MNKYNDIEIQTAKNLLEKGFKWIGRNETGRLFAHDAKPIKVDTFWWSVGDSDCVCNYVPIFKSVHFGDKEPTSLERIVHPQILDDVEKRYLKGVIRPFRDKVLYIAKRSIRSDSTIEYISIQLAGCEFTCLPCFKKGTMYKGMKPDHWYSLEELGL